MKKLRTIILFILPFICWGALALHFLNQGNAWAATFAALPFLAFIFLIVSPFKGPGHYAFTNEVGPKHEEEETERQYHFKMAKWWFLGSLLFPFCIATSFVFSKYEGFAVVTMFVGIMLGIPCFLKGLGSLFLAVRSKS